MEYVLDICMGIVQERAFRSEVCDPKPRMCPMSQLTVFLLFLSRSSNLSWNS
jgi:hypothetical protein